MQKDNLLFVQGPEVEFLKEKSELSFLGFAAFLYIWFMPFSSLSLKQFVTFCLSIRCYFIVVFIFIYFKPKNRSGKQQKLRGTPAENNNNNNKKFSPKNG